jgi:hypothetical protein
MNITCFAISYTMSSTENFGPNIAQYFRSKLLLQCITIIIIIIIIIIITQNKLFYNIPGRHECLKMVKM